MAARTIKGLRLYHNTGTKESPVWQEITGLFSYKGGVPSIGTYSTTKLNDVFPTYGASFPSSGTMSFELYWDDADTAQQEIMQIAWAANPKRQWKTTFSTGSQLVVEAIPTIEPTGSIGSANTATLSLLISGVPVWTYPTPSK